MRSTTWVAPKDYTNAVLRRDAVGLVEENTGSFRNWSALQAGKRECTLRARKDAKLIRARPTVHCGGAAKDDCSLDLHTCEVHLAPKEA